MELVAIFLIDSIGASFLLRTLLRWISYSAPAVALILLLAWQIRRHAELFGAGADQSPSSRGKLH